MKTRPEQWGTGRLPGSATALRGDVSYVLNIWFLCLDGHGFGL